MRLEQLAKPRLKQPKQPTQRTKPPWLHSQVRVDWQVNDQEQIEMIVGQLESDDESNATEGDLRGRSDRGQEGESKLTIDPLTCEYTLAGDDRNSFWMFDLQQSTMLRIEPSAGFCQLKSCQWIIVSTSPEIESAITLAQSQIAQSQFTPSQFANPQQLATELVEMLGMEEKVMVLSRD